MRNFFTYYTYGLSLQVNGIQKKHVLLRLKKIKKTLSKLIRDIEDGDVDENIDFLTHTLDSPEQIQKITFFFDIKPKKRSPYTFFNKLFQRIAIYK